MNLVPDIVNAYRQLPVLGRKFGRASWPAALIAMVVIKAILSLAVKPGSFVVSYSGISYFLLLVLATGIAIRSAIRNTIGNRLFWTLLVVAFGLWATHQGLVLYYELGLGVEVPTDSIADSLLFLHVTALMAAVSSFPHRDAPDRKPYASVLNALLVGSFWIFLYGYAVFPYQYLYSSPAPFNYSLRFDILYLCANLALVLMVALLFPRAKTPWKSVYFHLLGASALYAVSSAIANLAIDYLGGYVNGKLYGLGLTASVCWFVLVPLSASKASRPDMQVSPFEGSPSSKASVWAMLVVVAFSIPVVWELLKSHESDELRSLRVVVAVVMIVCLASAAYAREYLSKRDVVSHFGVANDRLKLAMQAGTAVVWESDIKRGRSLLFGDLQTIFGIPSEVSTAKWNELFPYVHPDDRQRLSQAITDASQNDQLFVQECRIVRPDGAVRWLDARGKFYHARHGSPERMIGVALDITERKEAEQALSGMAQKLIDAQERERTRIARDLHDDVAQRLALLAIDLEKLETNSTHEDLRTALGELREQVGDVITSIQTMSHELHSSKLEFLGLFAAVKGFCAEFSDHHRVEIDVRSHGLPTNIPPEVSLCLFRVLQQALQNAAKHSGVKRFDVRIWGTPAEIHLTVSDLGNGFDVQEALKGRGIGLSSMKERIRLLAGELSIDSQPKCGTTIRARVPFRSSGSLTRGATEG